MSEQFTENVVSLLETLDVPGEDIEEARHQGPGELIALFADRAFVPGTQRLTRVEVAERAGIDVEQAAQFWRALGFPDVGDDERMFTEVDVEVLGRIAQLMKLGVIDPDLALQIARVIGRSTAQIAAAQVDTVRRAVDPEHAEALPALLNSAPSILGDLERWLVYIWRRHFAAEAKRAAMQIAAGEAGTAIVGFADLVGFTGISQQMDEFELANAVSRFEQTAVELIGRHGGRVVKMIGDEAMFEASTPLAGAEIALDLVEAFADPDDGLPDVRVGLASGAATRNQGDLFGTAPNLASRLVDEAYPASVLVSDSIHQALQDAPGFTFKSVRPRNLKGFGRTRYWVLRREGDEAPGPRWKLPIELPEIPFLERERD